MRKIWIAVAAVAVLVLAGFAAWWLAAPRAHVVIRLDRNAVGDRSLQDAMSAHLDDVEDRANSFGWLTRAKVRIDGDKFVIDISGFSDLKTLRQLFGPQPPLSIRLVDDAGYDPLNDERVRIAFPAPGEERSLAVRRVVLMTGSHFFGARPAFDTNGQPAVGIDLDKDGALAFAQITRRHAGKRIALLLGDTVITAPRIMDPITNGRVQITGNFTAQESENLASAIRASVGDWPFTLVEVRAAER
jgi:preprotein translocase subunit SecD